MTRIFITNKKNKPSSALGLARIFSLTTLIWICAIPLANADDVASSSLQQSERIKRLQDIAINTDGWSMTMAGMQPGLNAGSTPVAGYSALQNEMHAVMTVLAKDQDNEEALNRQELLKDRVENRILANLDAGYLYATGVYIDMLHDIAPHSEKVILYRQQVADIKSFNELSRKFDQALAENRLSVPQSNCAQYYLQQIKRLQFVDADKVSAAEARLRTSQQLAFNG